jgi:hypothetical protein
MTPADRLVAMAEAARAVLVEAGVPSEAWWCDGDGDRRLDVGMWSAGGGVVRWSVSVRAATRPPHGRHGWPWAMTMGGAGHVTPLALRVLTALDELMPEDRER